MSIGPTRLVHRPRWGSRLPLGRKAAAAGTVAGPYRLERWREGACTGHCRSPLHQPTRLNGSVRDLSPASAEPDAAFHPIVYTHNGDLMKRFGSGI